MFQPDSHIQLMGSDFPGSDSDSDDASVATRVRVPRGTDGYAQHTRKLERTLGWVLWLGFAAVLVLSSL